MKKRSIKLLAILMAIICAFCAINVTAYADELKTDTVSVSYSNKLSKPKVKISVTSTEEPTLKLSWDNVEGANKYYIYRRDSKTGSLKLVAKTSKLYYKDTNVKKNKTYYYRVKAYQIKNKKIVKKSDSSSTVSKAIVSLSKVKNVKATAVSDSKIKLSWDKVSGATRYYLYYSTSKNGTYKSIGYVTKNSYTFTKLNSSTTYYFKVKSAKKIDSKVYKSSYSPVASAKTNAKNGEFIVDFKKISNKEAGLPTGSAMTCLAMLLNHYGVDVSAQEVYKNFDCRIPYYNDKGELWCDYTENLFVGDPTTKEKYYGYGTYYTEIKTVGKKICSDKGLKEKWKTDFGFWADDFENAKQHLKDGNIYLIRLNTSSSVDAFWWDTKANGSYQLRCFEHDEKYVILCGYTDNKEYIVYDPATDKFEKYYYWPENYFLCSAIIALEK